LEMVFKLLVSSCEARTIRPLSSWLPTIDGLLAFGKSMAHDINIRLSRRAEAAFTQAG
jgi:hypothetical protein